MDMDEELTDVPSFGRQNIFLEETVFLIYKFVKSLCPRKMASSRGQKNHLCDGFDIDHVGDKFLDLVKENWSPIGLDWKGCPRLLDMEEMVGGLSK